MLKRLLLLLMFICLWTIHLQAQSNKYLNITTFGFLSGTSADKNQAPLSIIMEHHYRFGKHFSAGVIIGIDQLQENTMPLGMNVKLYLPTGGSSLFISAAGGYAVSLEKPSFYGIKKANGGGMAGIEGGTLIRINDCFSLFCAIGYRYNKLHYELDDWWIGYYKRNYAYNRFVFRLGIAID